MMFRTDRTLSDSLFAFNARDLLPSDCDTELYVDLFDNLDLSEFYGSYKGFGETPIDPKLILRTVFYGLTHGIASMRKLEKACLYDNRFRVLSGEQLPGRRTLDRFFHRHAKATNALFSQVVSIAREMGLVSLGQIAIDGVKLKANTSKHKAMSYERMVSTEAQILTQLEALRASLKKTNGEERGDDSRVEEEVLLRQERLAKIQAAKAALEAEARARNEAAPQPKAQKSFNDHDALPILNKGKEFFYGYNVQAAVCPESQIVVAEKLHNSSGDSKGLPTVLGEVIAESAGEVPENVLADAGYASGENLVTVEGLGAIPHIACGKGEDESGRRVEEELTPVPEKDCYRCPKGKLIPQRKMEADGSRTLDVPEGFCHGCPRQGNCLLFRRQGRSVKVPPEKHRAARVRNAQRMRTEAGKRRYGRRKLMEGVFGNIKSNKGMRILVTGREKVAVRVRAFFTAHNIEKIVAAQAAREMAA